MRHQKHDKGTKDKLSLWWKDYMYSCHAGHTRYQSYYCVPCLNYIYRYQYHIQWSTKPKGIT